MTLLVTPLAADDLVTIQTRAEEAWSQGATAIELRLDAFRNDPVSLNQYLCQHSARTWILTCRSVREGGRSTLSPLQRAQFLAAAAQGTESLIDFEFADWQSSSDAQTILRSLGNARLVLSQHDFEGPMPDLPATLRAILETTIAPVAKAAYRPGDLVDSFAALDCMRTLGARAIPICMGEEGIWSRILAKKFDAFASFAACGPDSATASGQLTLRELFDRFRWSALDASTKVFGVIGDPIAQSMSPLLFNEWFTAHGVNAVYVPLRVSKEHDCLGRFLSGCLQRPWLDMGGLSVTHPHKIAAREWLGSGCDRATDSIGAVNTLVRHRDGFRGFNTDCHAAIDSLVAALGGSRADLRSLTVDVLGTGGSAAAVVSGLRDFGCQVTIFGRSPIATRALAQRFQCQAVPWNDRLRRTGRVLINCTRVGMAPDWGASPMPPDALTGCQMVFDLIYNPTQTQLLRDAAVLGIITLNGMDMFLRQAATQFELWTGLVPDLPRAQLLLEQALSRGLQPARSMVRSEARGSAYAKGIALIGLRGCGKSTVARLLARRLGMTHIDTDEWIERRSGRSIAELFAAEGEPGFRDREVAAVARAVAALPAVISVGGGAVLDSRNIELLRRNATVVWLTASPQELWRRVESDPASRRNRPPLTALGGLEEISYLLAQRTPLYRSIAAITVQTDQRRPEAIAEEVAEKLKRT